MSDDCDPWAWLSTVDPATVERERFNVNARTVRRREGTHLGSLPVAPPTNDVRILRAVQAQRELVDKRGDLHQRIRTLETTLARERREHASRERWQQKLTTWGHRHGGPSSLETA